VAIFAVWNAFKLIRWAVTPSPTGLENMPVYSISLGCASASYTYGGPLASFSAPIGVNGDHSLEIRGGAVGTITMLEGAPSATKIQYEMDVRTDDKALLDDISKAPPPDGGASRVVIYTPRPGDGQCIRYDIKVFVPPNLKKLKIDAHTIAQVQFDPESHIQLDDLFVTLFSTNTNNMILPHDNLRAQRLALEVFEGWIVGDASIAESTKLTTQRGGGVMNVRVHPSVAVDPESPEVAHLRTTSGSGRTDVFYINHDIHIHRPISSIHMSSKNADMYLTYRDAHFSGLIELDSKSYAATGVQKLASTEDSKWTHWVGDQQGKDEIHVQSRNWVGLYF